MRPRDLGGRLHQLHTHKVPGASGWEWVATPGHSPGHICLFRASDRVLLTGDALVTVNMDSWVGLIGARPQLAGAIPAAKRVGAHADRLRCLAERQILPHMRKHCIGELLGVAAEGTRSGERSRRGSQGCPVGPKRSVRISSAM